MLGEVFDEFVKANLALAEVHRVHDLDEVGIDGGDALEEVHQDAGHEFLGDGRDAAQGGVEIDGHVGDRLVGALPRCGGFPEDEAVV